MVVVCQFHDLCAVFSLIKSLGEIICALSIVLAVLAFDLVVYEPAALSTAVIRGDYSAVAILHAMGVLTFFHSENLTAVAVRHWVRFAVRELDNPSISGQRVFDLIDMHLSHLWGSHSLFDWSWGATVMDSFQLVLH